MSEEKTHVITDAKKPKLRGRVKAKLSSCKPDKTTTLIALTGFVSMTASYVGTHMEIVGFTKAVNKQFASLAEETKSLDSASDTED